MTVDDALTPPQATMTLLMTDVVDSTGLAARLGDAAASVLWTAHDRMARDLLHRWQGREIDKSDGFLFLFERPAQAVHFALAYQRALGALDPPLQARAGLHVGPVLLRKNPAADVASGAKPLEVEGLAKPLTARVMALAQPGQTLLTAQALAQLKWAAPRPASASIDAAPDGSLALAVPVPTLPHGHWRVQGLEAPIELYAAGEPDTAVETSAAPAESAKAYRVVQRNGLWLPMRDVRHSLPSERDPFVGRTTALQALAQCFERGARLVSLLGLGGCGKSRLAQRFGWTWLGDYEGGVWFCDLTPARTLDGMALAVAQGLDVPLAGGEPVALLGQALRGRGPCLVVLDGFERVARLAEDTIGRWLDQAPDVRFIVTTREVLGIGGEQTLALAPLDLDESEALFRRRAAAARSDFKPTPADDDAILPLVRLLDGLPLAIELAAARVRVMPPRMLLQRMSERFMLLASTGGRRDRHATLRLTFDWSWDLLSVAEKSALAQLSVFQGGFSLTAAEVLLDLRACPDEAGLPWAMDLVQSLTEKSWLRAVGDHRFDLLSTVSEYAAEHLATPGRFEGSGPAAREAAHERHWRHFAGLTEAQAVADACADIDNLVLACRRSAAKGDAACAAGALISAWAALARTGPFRAGAELAATVRQVPGLQMAQAAWVEAVAASAAQMQGRHADSAGYCAAGLRLARQAGDVLAEAWLLSIDGDRLTIESQPDAARTCLTEALRLARAQQDRSRECRVLRGLGKVAHNFGHFDDARNHYESALGLARQLGDTQLEGGLLGNLGGLAHAAGDLAVAREHYQAALALASESGDRRWGANTRCNLGLLLHGEGLSDKAVGHFEAVLATAREIGHPELECIAQCNLGIVAQALGQIDAALQHQEHALAVALRLADRRTEGQVRGYLGPLYACVGRADAATAALTQAESLLTTLDDRFSLGLVHCQWAEALLLLGQAEAARGALLRARSLAVQLGAGPDTELGRSLQRLTARLDPH